MQKNKLYIAKQPQDKKSPDPRSRRVFRIKTNTFTDNKGLGEIKPENKRKHD
jgi:hypothetical protein